jgi:hypothetical protein
VGCFISQVFALDAPIFTVIPLVVGGSFLVFSESLLYMMKNYIRAGKEDTSSSRIVIWYGESYKEHSLFWNVTRHVSWTFGASIIALWLQNLTGNDLGLLVGIFLMTRFSVTRSISNEASQSFMTKRERKELAISSHNQIAWRSFIKYKLKQSESPAEALRDSIMKMRETDTLSRYDILQILESLINRNDEVGAEARLLMDEIQSS